MGFPWLADPLCIHIPSAAFERGKKFCLHLDGDPTHWERHLNYVFRLFNSWWTFFFFSSFTIRLKLINCWWDPPISGRDIRWSQDTNRTAAKVILFYFIFFALLFLSLTFPWLQHHAHVLHADACGGDRSSSTLHIWPACTQGSLLCANLFFSIPRSNACLYKESHFALIMWPVHRFTIFIFIFFVVEDFKFPRHKILKSCESCFFSNWLALGYDGDCVIGFYWLKRDEIKTVKRSPSELAVWGKRNIICPTRWVGRVIIGWSVGRYRDCVICAETEKTTECRNCNSSVREGGGAAEG